MAITSEKHIELENLCRTFRSDVIRVLHERQTGHPGGSLSVCEILTALYFYAANIEADNADDPNRDRVVLSKGHAAPMLYRILAEKGFFDPEEMHSLRTLDSRLQGHPCSHSTPGVDMTSGPLGIGLSAALGMALGLRCDGSGARVYAVLGDGELNEGTIWEACMSAAKFGADHLTAIVDWNGVQLDGTTEQVMPLGDLCAKFSAFGWRCIECDGHDITSLCSALDESRLSKGVPCVILARTVKGKGVSFMEGKNTWHGKPIGEEEFKQAIQELEAEAVCQ